MIASTVAQTAIAINQVRKSVRTEEEFNLFLVAIERHHGTAHMVAAHRLASELLRQEEEEIEAIMAAAEEYDSGILFVTAEEEESLRLLSFEMYEHHYGRAGKRLG